MTSRRIRVAFIVFGGFMAASAILMQAGGSDLPVLGGATQLSAAPNGRIWMIVNHEVLRTDADGVIETRFTPAALALEAPLTAIAALPDGGAWVGQVGGPIVRIDASGAIVDRLDPATTPSGPLQRTFKLAVDPATQTLLVTDTGHHRLLAFDRDGSFVKQSAAPWRFPNGIAPHPDGHLVIADTNGLRFAAVDAALQPIEWTLPDTRELRQFTWPLIVSVAPDGTGYYSWHADDLRPGAVLVHNREGRFQHSLDLPEGSQPQALLAREYDVLMGVQEPSAYRIRRFTHGGTPQADFGGAELTALLADAWRRYSRAKTFERIGQNGLLLSALGLLLTALIARRRQDAGVAEELGMPEETDVPVLQGSRVHANIIGLGLVLALGAPVTGCLLIYYSPPSLRLFSALLSAATFGALFVVVIRRLQSDPAYAQWRERQLDRLARAWAPHLPALLREGEKLLGHAAAPGAFLGRILFATDQRLLALPVLAGPRRAPLWQAELSELAPVSVRPTSGWTAWLAPGTEWIELDTEPPRRRLTACVYAGSYSQHLLDLIARAIETAQSRTQEISGDEPGMAPAPEHPPVARVVLLSLLLPGSGHLHQRRTQMGVFLLGLALLVLVSALPVWFTAMLNASDYPPLLPWKMAAIYGAVVAFAVLSAATYARSDR